MTKKTPSLRTPKRSKPNPPGRASKPALKPPSWWTRLVFLFFGLCCLLGVWLIYLDAQVTQAFDGKKWALPAKVYARPLTLYPSLKLSPEQLESELQWADYRFSSHADRVGTYAKNGSSWVIHRRSVPFWDGSESVRKIRLEIQNDRVVSLHDQEGEQALIRLEPQYIGGIFPTHNEDRDLIRLEDAPPVLVAALIITEDKRFFEHHGVSILGIIRAMKANIQAGRMVQGGSTITQQLVKNFFLTNERTLSRKIQEALMALLLELHYDKEAILEAYLNEVYLGQAGRRSIHGFGLAARFYFGKPLAELDHAEIATLVGLVKGASYYNPRRNPERSKARRDLVLSLMAEQKVITHEAKAQAQSEPLLTASPKRHGQREFPAFLELAKQQLQRDYRLEDLQSEGLRIYTTFDPWVQNSIEKAAEKHLNNLETWHPGLKDQLETAAVVTSVGGGEVRALLGSRNATYFGFNRALNARRQIGSLAKPAVYLSALRSGRYHWGSWLDDSPIEVPLANGDVWQPQNYNKESLGAVTMVDAFKLSLNQATAQMGMDVGVPRIAQEMERLGVQRRIPAYPSILLGSVDLTPLEVAHMYQSLSSEGFVMPLRTIDAVTKGTGETLSSYAIQGKQAYRPEDIEWLRYGLEQVAQSGTARSLSRTFSQTLAGKTGTSDQQRDAWFAGFDQRYLGVVWVGRDDNRPTPFTGSSAALPIWKEAFKRIGVESLSTPIGLEKLPVDDSGQVFESGCSGTLYPFPIDWDGQTIQSCQRSFSEVFKSWFGN